ncbi:MAG: hypothetical protein ACD_75C01699G0003 [uncultured bacterium]|nr:MAG: hypothetical protein ACD_75C01699G0003 [uncultured bacterium]
MTVHVMQPKSSKDRESIYRFLYEIWSDEFCRSMEGMDHEQRLMKDALDETAQHLIAVDRSGRIVGCVRTNVLGTTALPDNFRNHLRSEELAVLFGGEEIRYASHFAVAPDARGRTVASLLIGALHPRLEEIGIEPIPITASALGRESFFSIVYSFKRQVFERAGDLDDRTAALFGALEALIRLPTTFAMTTVYVAHGVVA